MTDLTLFEPAAVLDAAIALAPGEGIHLTFSTDRAMHSFRGRLYAKRNHVREQSKKYPESEAIIDPDYGITPWDEISVIVRSRQTLWVGVPDAKAFGIVKTRVTTLKRKKS